MEDDIRAMLLLQGAQDVLEQQGDSGRQGLECLRHLGENGDWGSVSGRWGEGAAGEAIGKDEQGKRNSGRERSGGQG